MTRWHQRQTTKKVVSTGHTQEISHVIQILPVIPRTLEKNQSVPMIFQPQLGTLRWQLLGFLLPTGKTKHDDDSQFDGMFKKTFKAVMLPKDMKNLFRIFFSVFKKGTYFLRFQTNMPRPPINQTMKHPTQLPSPQGDHLQRLLERL